MKNGEERLVFAGLINVVCHFCHFFLSEYW